MGIGALYRLRQSAGNFHEFDGQLATELDGFLDALFTLVLAL